VPQPHWEGFGGISDQQLDLINSLIAQLTQGNTEFGGSPATTSGNWGTGFETESPLPPPPPPLPPPLPASEINQDMDEPKNVLALLAMAMIVANGSSGIAPTWK